MERILNAKEKVRYKIELDTMNDVREFVAIAAKCEDKVVLRAGSLCVNAKSLLGVVIAHKVNWNELTIESDRDYYGEFRKFIID